MKARSCRWMVLVIAALASCSPPEAQTLRRTIRGSAVSTSQSQKPFSRGDSFETVRAAMGEPDSLQERDADMTIWNYEFSTVVFRHGKVSGWNNVSGNLRTSGAGETGENMVERNRESRSGGSGSVSVSAGIVGMTNASGTGSGATNPSTQRVESHHRANGTFVPAYIRTRADSSRANNFSTQGNSNPHTGKRGYR